MTISTSANLGLTIPGSTAGDKRLADMQAVKSAIIGIDSAIANVIATNANIGGNSAIDFSAKNFHVSGDLIPTSNKINSIGSATNRFKAIYVDEAHLSINTLYLGDTPILGTSADVVNIKADLGQSINVKTIGSGLTMLNSEQGVIIQTTGVNGDILMQATGIGSKTRMTAAQSIDITAPEITSYGNHTVSGNGSISGNLTVTGSMTVNGSVTSVNSTTVTTKDNIIEVNKGQVGSGVSAGKAGISVDRGDEPAYQMVFDETDDMFKVGMVGQLQTIASQSYVVSTASPLNHTHAEANGTLPGFMSVADKTKLDASPLSINLYTKTEVTAMISAAVTGLQAQMYSHG